jgi:hypothetical protein
MAAGAAFARYWWAGMEVWGETEVESGEERAGTDVPTSGQSVPKNVQRSQKTPYGRPK